MKVTPKTKTPNIAERRSTTRCDDSPPNSGAFKFTFKKRRKNSSCHLPLDAEFATAVVTDKVDVSSRLAGLSTTSNLGCFLAQTCGDPHPLANPDDLLNRNNLTSETKDN